MPSKMGAFSMESSVRLASGYSMPTIGFGVWRSQDTQNSVKLALDNKFRHIDTARFYKNEKEVGDAILKSGLAREDIFLTSKVHNPDHGTELTAKAIKESLNAVSSSYFDLYLIHNPLAGQEKRKEAWEELVKAQEEGKIRTIGVSNFNPTHIKQLIDAKLPKPAVNQIELHPFCQQRDIVKYCKEHEIVIQAFCPIARARYFDNPVIKAVSESSKRTPAQVMIRWSIQKGYVPITKTDKAERMIENQAVFDFELTQDEMEKLDSLDKGAAGAVSPNPVDAL